MDRTAMPDVLTMFQHHVESQPSAIALDYADGTTTYRELDQRARQIARRLCGAGVVDEQLVAILLERGPDVPAAMLASWMADTAFLPLGPTDPPARVQAMLADSGATLALTTRRLATRLPSHVQALVLEEILGQEKSTDDQRHTPIPPDRLAYAIYTSGSTGRPKAALLEHRGLAAFASWMRDGHLAFCAADRVLQWATPTVDACVGEIVQGLASGATLVCPKPDADLVDLGELLRRADITVATLTPTVWGLLPDDSLSGLRLAVSAGEQCPPDLAARLSLHATFANAYGPTEATICTTVALSPPTDRAVIGRPIAEFTVSLDDTADDEDGGELLIGGPGLARGYLARPRLTAERFVPDPDSAVPGGRVYCSGDRVRRGADQQLEFLGRTDDQVKIHGFRVELGEIEQALRAHADVTSAAVTAVQRDGTAELVAFVIPRLASGITAEAVRLHLRTTLPPSLIPVRIHTVKELPLTPWGKVDRQALAEPVTRDARPAPEATATEQGLLTLWRRIVGNELIGLDDDFFEVGGNSLLAMRIVGELRRSQTPTLSIRALFENPTVRLLATYLDADA